MPGCLRLRPALTTPSSWWGETAWCMRRSRPFEIPRDQRPVLGLVPCGNGNDYARTLGMPFAFDAAFAALSRAVPRAVDVGIVNGTPFMQTLSFGLDAAIALGTHERRVKTGHMGTRLFLEEGIEQLVFHRDEYPYELSIDGAASERSSMFLFAVQIGPTYGGGFDLPRGRSVRWRVRLLHRASADRLRPRSAAFSQGEGWETRRKHRCAFVLSRRAADGLFRIASACTGRRRAHRRRPFRHLDFFRAKSMFFSSTEGPDV